MCHLPDLNILMFSPPFYIAFVKHSINLHFAAYKGQNKQKRKAGNLIEEGARMIKRLEVEHLAVAASHLLLVVGPGA